jgi:effector-binding domain-containing protein
MSIQETAFEAKTYLTLKKSVSIEQITDKQMYDDAGKKLGAYMAAHGLAPAGPWSVLYFVWDETGRRAEIGIAFPIDGLASVADPELSVVSVPASAAALSVLKGPYDGLGALHRSLARYVADKGYTGVGLPVIAVEEYAVGPQDDPDPANWMTNVYYLHA